MVNHALMGISHIIVDLYPHLKKSQNRKTLYVILKRSSDKMQAMRTSLDYKQVKQTNTFETVINYDEIQAVTSFLNRNRCYSLGMEDSITVKDTLKLWLFQIEEIDPKQ